MNEEDLRKAKERFKDYMIRKQEAFWLDLKSINPNLVGRPSEEELEQLTKINMRIGLLGFYSGFIYGVECNDVLDPSEYLGVRAIVNKAYRDARDSLLKDPDIPHKRILEEIFPENLPGEEEAMRIANRSLIIPK